MKTSSHNGHLYPLLLLGIFFSGSLSAEIIDGSHWQIRPGDSLYKIARTLFPGDSAQQAQLRKALIKNNPQAFKNGAANIRVGDRLVLPDFARPQPEPEVVAQPTPVAPVVKASASPAHKNTPPPASETTAVVTPDPEDVVGQVIINIGKLSAENRGVSRPLKRRSAIYRGDTLSTGSRGHTQIRLKDGALLSLRPYTDIRIAEYNYNGQQDGSERSLLELLKGGFRTITGAIGHRNKQNYRVRTSVATIGIRGTHYSLVLCQQNSCSDNGEGNIDDGLYGAVADGSIEIENDSGIHRFSNDQFFQVRSRSAAPVEFLLPPAVLKSQPAIQQHLAQAKAQGKDGDGGGKAAISQRVKSQIRRLPIIIQANQPDFSKRPKIPVNDLNLPPVGELAGNKAPNGSAMLLAFNYRDDSGAMTGVGSPIIINAKNTNEILLTDLNLANGAVGRIPFAAREFSIDPSTQQPLAHELVMVSPSGVPASIDPSSLGGSTLGVNWGRWVGDYTVLENGKRMNTAKDLHFIYSENLTSPTQLANLGGLGAAVNYSVVGGTLPTDNTGTQASVLASIILDANFITQQINNYEVSTTVNNRTYQAAATNIPFADLNRSFTIEQTVTACVSGLCSGDASVRFVGAQAQGAITSFSISEPDGSSGISGTAFLDRTGGAFVGKP